MPKTQLQRQNLIAAKALFFMTAMCGVGWSKFQNNFYLDNGLSSREIGTLKSVGLILKMAGEPFWSMIADLTDQKLVFVLCMVMQIVTMEILRVSTPLTYSLIFFVKVLRTTTAPSSTLTTTASFKLTEGTKEGYGQQRMFGSLAWGGGALITGFLIDTYGMNALFYYTYFFNLVSLTFVVIGLPGTKRAATDTATLVLDSEGIDKDDLMVEEQGGEENPLLSVDANQQMAENMMRRSRSLEGATGDENQNQFQNNLKHDKHSQGRKVVSYMRELYAFMCNPPCRSIILNSFFYGIVMTIPDTFLFVSLERDFRATRTYSGMVTTASIMACLPLFWFSGPLIARQGHFNLIFLSESSCVLRLLVYSALSPRWSMSLYLLPFIQLIHGLNFALYWSTSVDAIYKLAPPELTTICIAALNISYYTFGGAVGNIVFGHIYDTSGGADAVYRCGGAILIMTLLLLKSQEPIITAALSRHSHSTDSSN